MSEQQERPAKGAPDDSGQEVKPDSTAGGGRGGAVAWGKVPRSLATMKLSKNAMRAFIVLSSFANGGTRAAWPTQDTLARELGWITRSTGRTDRRRIARAINELVAAGVVRRDKRQSLGGHAWSWRFLVAPFHEDASPSDASSPSDDASPSDASSWMSPSDDASVSALTMRAFQREDASPSDAQTDLRNRPSTDQGIAAKERHEGQDRDNHKPRTELTDEERARRRREFEELVEADVQRGSA